MKKFFYGFRIGRRETTVKKWVVYSLGTATAVGLIVHFGNMLLVSKYGELFRDAACAASKVVPDGDLARLMSTLCRASKDGVITPVEAKAALGRAQQVTGQFSEYFDNDRDNTDLRAEDEVDFAIEGWKRLNPSPKIDPRLKKQFPEMTEKQLCVLSQAERYVDGDAIGIRYVGMSVCEDE